MNSKYNSLIKFIDKFIKKEKIYLKDSKYTKWDEVFEISQNHKIEALIYSSFSKEVKDTIDKSTLEKWKRKTFISGIKQQNHMREVEHVLSKFNDENIQVLVLKGLIIRELYSNPLLRTMSDADIVVKEEDLEKSIELILSLGYSEIERSPSHYVYYKSGCKPIELHWNLADEHFFKQINLFENDMYKNIEDVNIGSAKAKSMGIEDLAIFQCIHMAKHIVYRGFGVRHLIDFTLLVNKERNNIDWINLLNRCEKYGIYKFVIGVFLICNELFNLEIPKSIEFINKENKSYLKLFMEDIFNSGVHGKQDFVSSVASEFAYTSDKEDGRNESSLSRYMKFIFPPVDNMSNRYDYAKKNKILTPIAWLHHLIRGVFNKDYSLKDKVNFTTKTVGLSQKRNDLISWLEL